MASIHSVNIAQQSFSFSQFLSSVNGKTVQLISSIKVNAPLALAAVKKTALNAGAAVVSAIKTLAAYWYYYASIYVTNAIAIADTFTASAAATLGPYYPILATSVVSFALGASVMYKSMQNQDDE